jgi:hypothetical protein
VNRRDVLGPAVAILVACVVLSACGGGAKASASSSASPASGTSPSPVGAPVVVFGGPLTTVTPRGGAQKGRTLPGSSVMIHVNGGSLLFVVVPFPKTAVFHSVLYALPQLRRVPIHVTVTTKYGWKTYHVRPSQPLTPGAYELRFGGEGRYQMSIYEPGSH